MALVILVLDTDMAEKNHVNINVHTVLINPNVIELDTIFVTVRSNVAIRSYSLHRINRQC